MIERFLIDKVGANFQKEDFILKKGRKEEIEFPALIGIIEHKLHGYMLFDTGYSQLYFEGTEKYPMKLHRKLGRVEIDDSIEEVLGRYNIRVEEVNYVFISHFHPDHIGNLNKFVNAKFFYSKKELDMLQNLPSTLKRLEFGYFPNMIPGFLRDEAIYLEDLGRDEDGNIDLFGDNSLKAVPLFGHRNGQHGLKFHYKNSEYFLIADGLRLMENLNERSYTFGLKLLIEDYDRYKKDSRYLHRIRDDVKLIPSHCKKSFDKYQKELNDLDKKNKELNSEE